MLPENESLLVVEGWQDAEMVEHHSMHQKVTGSDITSMKMFQNLTYDIGFGLTSMLKTFRS